MNFRNCFLIVVCFPALFSNAAAQEASADSPISKTCAIGGMADQTAKNRRNREAERQKTNEILSVARARTSALIARDADKLRALLSPDFVYTNASGKVLDREAYIKNYALEQTIFWSSQTLSDVCVRFVSDTAVMTAITHDIARFGEYRLDARFRTTQIYRRSPRGWIYLAGHTSNIE